MLVQDVCVQKLGVQKTQITAAEGGKVFLTVRYCVKQDLFVQMKASLGGIQLTRVSHPEGPA